MKQNGREIIEGLLPRTSILVELSAKFENEYYKDGISSKCQVDRMTCGKWCAYSTDFRNKQGGYSYKTYENMEDFYDDFDVVQVFRAKRAVKLEEKE
jgi:hypothetical protein